MSSEEHEYVEETASESLDNQQSEEKEEQTMVPLSALQAERRKRQEYESRNRMYEEMISRNQQANEPDEEEDPESLLTKGSFAQEKAMTKREILEQVYQDMNPQAVDRINNYLKPILDKKPWLASSIDNSLNRLARANEIVEDYMHILNADKKKHASDDAKRIVQNSKKPKSPVEIGNSAQPVGTEFLKSIQGKKEFREYRKKVLRGEA